MSASSRTSLWAIASLVCALIPVPPACLLAIVLGGVGLAQTRRRSGVGGRRLAVAGIVLGLLVTAGYAALGGWLHVNVRRPLVEGPREALARGLAGDVDAFRAAFRGDAPAGEATAFLATLARRYGALRGVALDPAPRPDGPPARPTVRGAVAPYRLLFAGGDVPAEAEFVVLDGPLGPLVLRWRRLTILDAERGDFTYPDAAAPEPSPDEAPAEGRNDAPGDGPGNPPAGVRQR